MTVDSSAPAKEFTPLQAALAAVRAHPYDLTARAQLAIHAATRLKDPELGGLPYSYAEFQTNPPIAFHSPWDYYDTAGRLLAGLTLARIMTGTAPDENDAVYSALLGRHQRTDGLLELPAAPWNHTQPIVEMEWSPRGALSAWNIRAAAASDVEAASRADRLVKALLENVCREGSVYWFPSCFLPASGWLDTHPPMKRLTDVLIGGQIILPLTRFAATTGSEEAMDLAFGLIRFLRERSGAFDEEGNLTSYAGRYFHSNTNFLLGVLEYGALTGEERDVEWAEHAAKKARAMGTEFGFFPYSASDECQWQGDTCTLTDMIAISILLGLRGDPNAFADAERFGRNHLLESQFTDFSWTSRKTGHNFNRELWSRNHTPEGFTQDHVCDRALGAFAGWTLPNDAIDPANPRLMQRCTGSGMHALYLLWHYAITHENNLVQVNLHFSRDSRWAAVTSLLPAEGGLEVFMKTRGTLKIRSPHGVDMSRVELIVNRLHAHGDHLHDGWIIIEGLHNGDEVVLRWPLEERAMVYDRHGQQYLGHWRGDTMVQIEPNGVLAPLYRRSAEVSPVTPVEVNGPFHEIDLL